MLKRANEYSAEEAQNDPRCQRQKNVYLLRNRHALKRIDEIIAAEERAPSHPACWPRHAASRREGDGGSAFEWSHRVIVPNCCTTDPPQHFQLFAKPLLLGFAPHLHHHAHHVFVT